MSARIHLAFSRNKQRAPALYQPRASGRTAEARFVPGMALTPAPAPP